MAGSNKAVKRGTVIGAATTAVALVAGTVVFVAFRDDGSNAWVYETGRSGIEHLVTDGETVCGIDSHGADERLVCLDGATGEPLFEQVASPGLVLDTIEDGILLANTEPTLEAYSLDGELLWSVPGGNADYDTAIADGVVLVMEANDNPSGSTGPDLVAVDLASGDEQWRVPGSDNTARGVFAAGGLFFYLDINRSGGAESSALELVALDPSSGDEVWRTAQPPPGDDSLPPINESILGAVATDDGDTVAVVEMFSPGPETETSPLPELSRLVVVDAGTGEPRRVQSLDTLNPTVAQMDGVVVTFGGVELQGWNSDGEELWTVDAPGLMHAGPAINWEGELAPVDDSLYFASQGLYEVDAHTGETTLLADQNAPVFKPSGDGGRNWAMTDDRLVVVTGPEELQGVPVDELPLTDDD